MPTCAMIRCSAHTYVCARTSAQLTPLPRICLFSQSTCHITGSHALLPRPRTPPSPKPQVMPLPLQQLQPLSRRVQAHAFSITQLSLVHFPPPSPTQWKWTAGNSTTPNTLSLLSEHHTLSGLSTHSTLVISLQLFQSKICPSLCCWHVTLLHIDAHFSRNSRNAPSSYQARPPYSTTSEDQESNPQSMGI
jgi:hypothetical protein